MIEQALRDPISVGMLAIDGSLVMEVAGEKPGPRVGWVLHALLEEVLDDPTKNTTGHLKKRSLELASLSDLELKKLGKGGKERKEEIEEEAIKDIRKKYYVE